MAYQSQNVNGQATMANSSPVVLASNQTAVPVSLTSTTITGTVAATQSGTWNIGTVTTLTGITNALPTGANTIGAVTQSGTWTVQPGNTANTTAWLVTGTGGTFPITAAALPLPTGAATSANQTTVGIQTTKINDGTTTAGVIVATTALKTDLSSVAGTATVTSAAGIQKVGISGNTGAALDAATSSTTGTTVPTNTVLVGGTFTTATPTITTGNMSPLQLDASGNLRTTQNATNIVLDANNSSSATLTAGSTFNAAGTGTDVSKYAQINITVAATQGTASPASMFVDFSTTNAFTVGVNTSSIPFFVWNNTAQQLNIPRFLAAGLGQFMRVRYINDGGTAANNAGANGPTAAAQNQTAFGLNVYLMPVATKEITIGMETSVTPYDPGILVRNVPNDGLRFTYVGSNNSFAAVTTPTITSDLFTLQGSATKTIRVTRILYSSQTGANQAQVLSVMRRSVVSTGGAYTTVTPAKMDPFNSAATAVFKFATTGGTAATGTTVANLDGRGYFSSGGTQVNDVYMWEADRPAQAIVLRGTSDFLTIQIVSGTVTGLQFNCSVEWVEDSS